MITIKLSNDEADLAVRAIAWAAMTCDARQNGSSDGVIVFGLRHTRDRCNVLAKKFSEALKVTA